MNEIKELKFKCIECQSAELEEIIIDIKKSVQVVTVTDDGIIEYSKSKYTPGRVDSYICGNCFTLLYNEKFRKIKRKSELIEWLKVHSS